MDLATLQPTPAVAARTRDERNGAIEHQKRVLWMVELLKQFTTAREHHHQRAWEHARLPKEHENARPSPCQGVVPRPMSSASTGRLEPVRFRSREPQPQTSSRSGVEEINSRRGGVAKLARWTRTRRATRDLLLGEEEWRTRKLSRCCILQARGHLFLPGGRLSR